MIGNRHGEAGYRLPVSCAARSQLFSRGAELPRAAEPTRTEALPPGSKMNATQLCASIQTCPLNSR
jgi:hypothetical protein